jgi:MATE family multidrug resistance protein
MTGLSLAMGLAAGLETLAGQAYGAGNYNNLGVLLQRAMLVCATVCAPVACLWLVSGPLLIAAGQEPAIAAEAACYLAACAPCLFLSVASECLRKFLQAQGDRRQTQNTHIHTNQLIPRFHVNE